MKPIRLATVLAAFLLPLSSLDAAGDEYDYDVPASFLDHVHVEREGGVDLNGDGRPDNALGALVSLLESMPGGPEDVDAILTEAIEDGTLAVGAAWPSFEAGVADAASVDAHFFEFVDNDDDPETHDAFFVDRRSFELGTSVPRHRFNGSVAANRVEGTASSFPIATPFLGGLILADLESVQIEARVVESGDGIAVTEGTIAGVIPALQLYDGLNELYRNECDCLGLDPGEDLFQVAVDEDRGTIDIDCHPDADDDACAPDDNDLCSSLSVTCSVVGIMGSVFDVDTDGDGINDGLSAYFSFTMVDTRLLGPFGVPDCNDNGVADDEDIASGTSADLNGNGLPDECEPPVEIAYFRRGDANADGATDISDAVFSLGFLFLGGSTPPCIEAANANGDAALDISDAVYGLGFLFLGGPPPPPPFDECGRWSAEFALPCESYDPCDVITWPSTQGTFAVESTIEAPRTEDFPAIDQLLEELFGDPEVFFLRSLAIAASGDRYFEEEPWNVLFECQDPEDCRQVSPTALGVAAAAALEAILDAGLLRETGDEFGLSEALADASRIFADAVEFTLDSRLEIVSDPDSTGHVGSHNSLATISLTWRGGGDQWAIHLPAEIAPRAEDVELALELLPGDPTYALRFSRVATGLRYRDIVRWVIESVVFPDYLTAESLDGVFLTLVDCEDLSAELEAAGLGPIVPAVESACETMQSFEDVDEDVWEHLLGEAHHEYYMESPDDLNCEAMVEPVGRRRVVQIGTPGDPCGWVGELRLPDDVGDGIPIDGSWWAERL